MTIQFFGSEVFQGHEKLALVTMCLICCGKTVICLRFTTELSGKSPELEKFALCKVNFTQTLNNRYERFIKQISKTPRAVNSISHKKYLKPITCQTKQVRYCSSEKNK